MDTVEDLEGADGDSVSEGALLPGLMSVWGEEDCQDVAISSAELQECLSRWVMVLMAALGLRLILEKCLIGEPCRMVILERPCGQCQEPIPMVRK
jgi:hypothetical protein